MTYEYSRDYINAELARQIDDLCRRLGLTFVRKYGLIWVKNPDRLDGGNFHSFSISPTKRMWKDFHAGKGGDLIKLIEVFARCSSYGEAVGWALGYLGLEGQRPDPIRQAQIEAEALQHAENESEKAKKRRAQAWAIWLGGTPLDGFDPPSLYLKDSRGIDIRQMPRLPGALRYVPKCYVDGQEIPAMVANISGKGGFLACHRTYLAQYNGRWDKAFKGSGAAAKRTLGSYAHAGGRITLSRGADQKVDLEHVKAGAWVAIGEGIENTLTVALARPDWRCLCAVSGANLGNVYLPKNVSGVHVIADNDSEPEAKKMLERSINRLLDRQLEVIVYRDHFGHKDMNEALTDG